MSKEQADVYFPQKVAQYQNFKNYINVPLTPSQEKALTSFEYNLGS
jgi:GH24 family phage-related lysozyme (muramidase)